MKNIKKISSIFLAFLIILSIIFLNKKETNNTTYYKNLKELNYNVTYKQAFPDQNFRYTVLTCIVNNICNEVDEILKESDMSKWINSTKIINEAKFTPEIKTKENELLNKEDLNKIKMIYFYSESIIRINKITSFRGIEFLSNLVMFYVNNSTHPEINLSFNPNIEYLKIYGENEYGRACDINIDNTTKLKEFVFDFKLKLPQNSNLKPLNFNSNLSLKNLQINNCKMPYINLSNNNLLQEVSLNNNEMNSFIYGNKLSLKKLSLEDNKISTLYLSTMPNLEELNIKNNNIGNLDFSIISNLKKLNIESNNFSSIDLSVLPLLEELYIRGHFLKNNITNLNLNSNLKLKKLYVSFTKISNLNLQNNLDLEELYLSSNSNLLTLNISNNTKLKSLTLLTTKIPEINLNNNILLERLRLVENNFSSIDLSKNIKLTYLEIMSNPNLSELNLNNNTMLKELYIQNNSLSKLNLNSEHLFRISADNNKLTSLDLTKTPRLTSIQLTNNKLTTLDLKNLKYYVGHLDVSNNLLTSLYLPNLVDLSRLRINNNKLKNLIPNGSPYSSFFINPKEQNIDIEVIKGKDVDIDIRYGFNYYRGILKENNELFEKVGEQKYNFKKIGTYTIDFDLYNKIASEGKGGTVTVTIKEGEAEKFEPIVNKLSAKEGYSPNFTLADYKNAITNLPTNINNFTVDLNQMDASTPGIKNIVTKITFSDDTEKEVVVPVEVEELTKEKYNPEITTKTVTRTTEITEEEYKKLITNLPNNIQRIDVVKKADTTVVGNHEAILNVVLRNGDIKEVKIPVIVSSIMADSFEPVYRNYFFYIGNYYYLNNNIANLPKVGLKESYYYIIDLITKVRMSEEQLKEAVSTKGLKNFKIKIFFPDNSSKEYEMPMTIYERKIINVDDVVFTPKNEEHIDYNNNKILITKHRHNVPKPYCNNETFECFGYNPDRYDYSATNIDGEITGPKGGIWFEYDKDLFVANTKRFNPGASKEADGPWDESYNNPSWGREEEKRVVEITGTKGEKNKLVQTVTILRDTDHDGIPDIDDEDDDNDGISDEQEVLDQTDPKDSTSFKVTKICYKVKG